MALGSLLTESLFAGSCSERHAQSARAAPAAFRPAGEARDLPAHGRRAVAARPVRLQAGTGRSATASRARRSSSRASGSPSSAAHPKLAGSQFKFARHGQSGLEISELLPHLAKVADDIAIVEVAAHRGDQPRARRRCFCTPASAAAGPAELRLVGHLRPGHGEPGPAGLRRAALRARSPAPARACGAPAFCRASIRASSSAPAAIRCCSCPIPTGTRAADRRRVLDAVQALNQAQLADVGDPEIATRISQYEMAFRMQTSVPELMDISQGVAGDARALRREAGQGVVRQQLPARAPAGRARRALRAALRRRLGPSQRPRDAPAAQVQGRRPGDGRAGAGSEAARPARRHAGHLGRRVRPHADAQGDRRRRHRDQARPRPSQGRVHHVAGRRRREARHHATARPTTSATTSSRIPSTSTISTRRCCTCSASTTSG